MRKRNVTEQNDLIFGIIIAGIAVIGTIFFIY